MFMGRVHQLRAMKNAFWGLVAFLFAYCLTGCGPKRIYEQGFPLAQNTWLADSILVYRIEVQDPTKGYDLFYRVRYDLDYPYYNLYVKVAIEDTSGKEQYADRHELVLLDPQTGKPLGAGLGGVYEKEFTALRGVHFPYRGTFKVRIGQYMRQLALPGLHEFGIRVSETE
jgi:gliding motility-associated lipoprotein GldH